MFWGLTPALDFQEELNKTDSLEEINILLVGGADCRHVLTTVARRYRHKKVRINFYITEAILESLAKQLLLLNIAFQPETALGLVHKCRIFMELYGNTLLRPAVAKYLKTSADELLKMITNEDYKAKIMPFVTFDLKYKHRDYLENVFKFWCSSNDFNICEIWDKVLRKHLGVRYDTRNGAFDWDLHMRMHHVGGQQVCPQEYRHWRSTGVAFTWLESEVSKPNRTLVCGVFPVGNSFVHYGYLGDFVTGPFVTYGLNCEDPQFLKRDHGQNAHRATDVTQRNLQQLLYEIMTGEEYEHTSLSDMKLGSTHYVESDYKVVDVGSVKGNKDNSRTCFELNDVNLFIFSIDKLKRMKHNEKFSKFFNLIYFGSTYLKFFDGETVEHISRSKGLLIIENQLFVLAHREKQLQEFGKTIKEHVQLVSSIVEIPFDPEKDCYAKFIINK